MRRRLKLERRADGGHPPDPLAQSPARHQRGQPGTELHRTGCVCLQTQPPVAGRAQPGCRPRLRVNTEYAGMIRRADNSADNVTMKNHLQEARWFIKTCRVATTHPAARRLAHCRLSAQFLRIWRRGHETAGVARYRRGAGNARIDHLPRNDAEIHARRAARPSSNFSSSTSARPAAAEASATAIRALIKEAGGCREPNKPLSNKIAAILADQGINVARRTVAKYRESIAIPPSNERKRLA